jgi:hypothetical protein
MLKGFTGPTCNIKIDYCASQPCNNNSTCTNSGNGYLCNCSLGYTGINCEQQINLCFQNPCVSG